MIRKKLIRAGVVAMKDVSGNRPEGAVPESLLLEIREAPIAREPHGCARSKPITDVLHRKPLMMQEGDVSEFTGRRNLRAIRSEYGTIRVMPSLKKIVDYADRYLRTSEIGDSDNALNGLQVENFGRVTRLGAAVDASTRTLRGAAAKKVDLLIVHHGLFWAGLQAVTGTLQRQLRIAFEHDIAVYGAHLPLDAHPRIGNNALLARSLGLTASTPFLEYKGQCIGLKARGSGSREQLVRKLEKVVGGPVKSFPFGPNIPRTIAVVTGAAGSEIHRVAEAGIDTFITGEAPHWAAVAAEELGINLLLGGHYATETFGVKALAAHLSRKFSVAWTFIDCPTGL